ncbi:MAG: DUF2750 domain-containing protein [Acidobacteria bacterium]|nr:MAG: DUF2750 domain-containing protein [Acidobacteriota bacterium]REK10066.1 MAG: DUF2750 domain-containing protein [Acidobacteriota bacterium]
MSKHVSEQELRAVTSLSGIQRYHYFIKTVTDWGEAWGLYDDGWALSASTKGERLFPLWPAAEYARLCASKQWAGFAPTAIALEDLLGTLLLKLDADQMSLSVSFRPNESGVVVPPATLARDLREEMRKYL